MRLSRGLIALTLPYISEVRAAPPIFTAGSGSPASTQIKLGTASVFMDGQSSVCAVSIHSGLRGACDGPVNFSAESGATDSVGSTGCLQLDSAAAQNAAARATDLALTSTNDHHAADKQLDATKLATDLAITRDGSGAAAESVLTAVVFAAAAPSGTATVSATAGERTRGNSKRAPTTWRPAAASSTAVWTAGTTLPGSSTSLFTTGDTTSSVSNWTSSTPGTTATLTSKVSTFTPTSSTTSADTSIPASPTPFPTPMPKTALHKSSADIGGKLAFAVVLLFVMVLAVRKLWGRAPPVQPPPMLPLVPMGRQHL